MTLVYPLRIELRDFKPAIYRDVLVDLAAFFWYSILKTHWAESGDGQQFFAPQLSSKLQTLRNT